MKNLSSCSAICGSIILLVTFSFPVTAQTTNPRWISEMPAPERILREIKGKDAADTAERQMGAFKHLMEIIDSMAYGLEHRSLQMPNKATPDEIRIKDMYWKAYAEVWYKAKNKNDIYIHDGDLHDEMMEKFFSKGFRELLLKSDNNRSAIYDKHRKESEGVVLSIGPKDQPAVESVEDVLRKGLKRLSNSLSPEPVTPGLSLRGFYKSPKFYANFWSERFIQVGCSGVNRNSSYTLERKGGQILLHIENDDDTVTLAFRPDLALVGPGPLAIHGFVPGGSTTTTTPGEARQVTTTTQVEMNRTEMSAGQQQNATQTGAQTYTVPQTTTSTEYTPPTTTTAPAPYIPKTVRCMAGTITPQPAAKPSNAPKEESTGLISVVVDALGGETVYVPNGLRMAGTYYGQGGANIEFLDHKAIVGCHVTRDENPYMVAFRNGEVIVNVEGAGAPLAFKLNLDGTLVGNGATIPIYGQKVVGKNQEGDPVYASSSDTCAYGTLSPQGTNPVANAATETRVNPMPANTNARPAPQGKSPMANAATETRANPMPANTNARPAPSATSSTVGSLAIMNGFAGETPNRFGNVSLIAVKQSFEDILRNAGFANSTTRQSAIANWGEMCKAQSPRCKQGIDAMKDSYLRMIKLGPNGNVSFSNVPPQTMWLVAIVPYGNQHFVWNLRVDVRAGTNTITFDKSNLATIY